MLLAYFREHPDELDHYMGEEEWNAFTTTDTLPEKIDKAIWQDIKNSTAPQLKPRTMNWQWLPKVAAAVLILLTGSLLLFKGGQRESTADTAVAAVYKEQGTFVIVNNDKAYTEEIALEDGSVVSLTAHSTLYYQKPFVADKRILRLEGKAFFKVAKDKTRPFIVTAGGLNTRALGTSFWIDAAAEQGNVKIQLVTGKVVIQKADPQSRFAFSDVYLNPGEEMYLNKVTATTTVGKTGGTSAIKKKTEEHIKGTAIAVLNFEQAPLPLVFKQLTQHYKIPILFREQDIDKMKFTGSYQAGDSLKTILNTITIVNKLSLKQTDRGYLITKP